MIKSSYYTCALKSVMSSLFHTALCSVNYYACLMISLIKIKHSILFVPLKNEFTASVNLVSLRYYYTLVFLIIFRCFLIDIFSNFAECHFY